MLSFCQNLKHHYKLSKNITICFLKDQYSRQKQLELLNDLIRQEKDYIEVLTFFYEVGQFELAHSVS